MAIIQSDWALGNRTSVRPQTSGAVHAQLYTFDFSRVALAAGDILELGELPPYCKIVTATLVPEGDFGEATVDVGLMSGEFGTDAADRTSGNELFAAQAVAFAPLTKGDALLLPAAERSRSIGVKFSGAVAAAAGKRLTLAVFLYQ